MGADEYVWTPCEDAITGEFIEDCPFWIGATNGCCLLVQRGMRPEDCPMDEQFQWWGYQSRTEQPFFSDEQIKTIRKMLTEKGVE